MIFHREIWIVKTILKRVLLGALQPPYLYRAVDKTGHTIDFLLSSKRDTVAAKRFFRAKP
jgi:hypothetical protein